MRALSDRMSEPTAGFDYLRLALAMGVLAWHSFSVTGGFDPRHYDSIAEWDRFRPILSFLLPAFFSLSGFLVAGSLARSRLDTFVALRAVRIMPALAVEVLLSALLLGPMLTNKTLTSYFAGEDFRTYLLNIIGHIHYELPGVFENNFYPNVVNKSLWTVPFELGCYVTLVVAAAFGLHRKPRAFTVLAAIASVALPLYDWRSALFDPFQLSGLTLIGSFLAGVTLYLSREKIPHSRALFFGCLVLSIALLSNRYLDVLAIWPAAYVTVYIGLLKPRRTFIISSGDYSYGVYLFAFPIQQALWLTPFGKAPVGNLASAIVLSLLYAAFSWHCVEKPILKRRKYLVTSINRWFDRFLPNAVNAGRRAVDEGRA